MKIKTFLMQNLFKTINMGRTAYADELPDGGTAPTTQPEGAQSTPTVAQPQQNTVSFETLIAKARQEEKDKLYPEITRLKGDIEDKVKRVNELLLSLGEKDETINKLNARITELEKGSKQSESETVKGLNIKIEELNNTVTLRDNEIATLKIDSYKQQKMSEAGGQLIPELVRGTTQEEINASIEVSKQRYAEILGQVKSTLPNVPTQPTMNTVPIANPNVQQFSTPEVNIGNLAGMNMLDKNSRAEFAKLRAQMGLK